MLVAEDLRPGAPRPVAEAADRDDPVAPEEGVDLEAMPRALGHPSQLDVGDVAVLDGADLEIPLTLSRGRAASGRVVFEGRDITGVAPHRLKGIGVARTFHECRVFPQFTCMENLRFALQLLGSERRARGEEALRMLRLVNLEAYADEPASSLSFGQRRLLEIVGTFIVRPKFLLLDEPASGVNPMLLETLSAFLRRMYEERPGVFLVVEHNMEFIMQLAGELIVMHQGAILERGAPADIQRSEKVVEAYLG